MAQRGLPEVHAVRMRQEINRTGLHRTCKIVSSYERHCDALRSRDVQYVLHTLLLIVRDPGPAAVARGGERAFRVVDPESVACACCLCDRHAIGRARVRHAVSRAYWHVYGIELRLDL